MLGTALLVMLRTQRQAAAAAAACRQSCLPFCCSQSLHATSSCSTGTARCMLVMSGGREVCVASCRAGGGAQAAGRPGGGGGHAGDCARRPLPLGDPARHQGGCTGAAAEGCGDPGAPNPVARLATSGVHMDTCIQAAMHGIIRPPTVADIAVGCCSFALMWACTSHRMPLMAEPCVSSQ